MAFASNRWARLRSKKPAPRFGDQVEALVEGGVDLFMLETFGYLEELHQAVLACRDVNPKIPIIAHVTIDEDGNCLDGSDPETFAARLTEWNVDVVGINCSVGPVAMLDAIERVRAVTSLPLAAQPNAGMPRSVEGTQHLSLLAGIHGELHAKVCGRRRAAGRRMLRHHARPHPRHEVALCACAKHAARPRSRRRFIRTAPISARQHSDGQALAAWAQRSRPASSSPWSRSCRPRASTSKKEIEGAKFVKSVGVDAVNIPDSPRASARMSNQALSLLMQQTVGIEAILHYTCRDRNVLGIQSDLLGAAATGINNLICITGDPPKMGNYPDATAVFDVDAIGLVNIVHNLNRGLDLGGNPIGIGTSFVIGVGANPGLPNLDEEIKRFEYKVQAGAEYVVTQPVFDLGLLEIFLKRIEHCRIPVVAGIWPLVSARNAEFMKNELRVSVPDEILNRMTAPPLPKPPARKAWPSLARCWRGSRSGAGRADQRSARPIYLRGRRAGGSGLKTPGCCVMHCQV